MTIHTIKLNVTDSEIELVKLLADGYTVPKISERLSMNRRTLEANVWFVKGKYKSTTLANLVAIFLRNKLID